VPIALSGGPPAVVPISILGQHAAALQPQIFVRLLHNNTSSSVTARRGGK
jgi:hypothetical protein